MSALFSFLFVASILLSIGLHEFGHFITAKRFGIKVQEFFVGFGPRLWSVRRGETEYGVKAFPIGGYVRIAGMNPLEEIAPEDEDRVFKAKAPWKRAIVLAAGSFTHFILGIGILAGILAVAGVPDIDRPTTRVRAVTPTVGGEDSPARAAGIQPGDELLSIDGVALDGSWPKTREVIRERGGRDVIIEVDRDGEVRALGPVRLSAARPDGTSAGFLGVGPVFERTTYAPLPAVGQAGKEVAGIMRQSLEAFPKIFAPSTLARLFRVAAGTQERTLEDPATPVGAAGIAGGFGRTADWVGLLSLIAGFNIFIGVVNLLPLPPLDGGHLAVLGYERLTRRDVDMRRLLPVTVTVIALFGSLFLLLLYLDIVSPLPAFPG